MKKQLILPVFLFMLFSTVECFADNIPQVPTLGQNNNNNPIANQNSNTGNTVGQPTNSVSHQDNQEINNFFKDAEYKDFAPEHGTEAWDNNK